MVEIQVNGEEFTISIPKNSSATKEIKRFLKNSGHDWVNSRIFVPNFPEKGRYLIKSAGYENMNAGG